MTERALDMRWKIANEAHSAELTITILYPTIPSEIIVLSKSAAPTTFVVHAKCFLLFQGGKFQLELLCISLSLEYW